MMPSISFNWTASSWTARNWKAVAAIGVIALAAACVTAPPARAQEVVARVNGEPITAIDVAQRTRLNTVSGSKTVGRKEVLDELIDELIKLQTAKRYRVEPTDADVDQVVAGMAGRMRATPQKFAEMLTSSGISMNALKRKLRADLAWNGIVRGKFQASLQVREKDVFAAVQSRNKGEKETTSYQYTLRPILLVVPRGAGDTVLEARRREAEALRTRFQNCDEGLRLARGLKDVAVREPITRSSGDLSAKQREVVDNTAVGRLTPPDVTPSGIEVFAVCAKSAGKGTSGADRDVREEMFGERFQAQGLKYLKELRRSAMIEFK